MELAEDIFSEDFYKQFTEKFCSIWENFTITEEVVASVKRNLLGLVRALYELRKGTLFDIDMAMESP